SALADHLAHVRVGDVEMDDRAAAARLALHVHGLLVLNDVLRDEAREVGVVGHSAGSTSVAATGSGSGSGAAGAAASTSAAAFAGAGRGRAARTPCSTSSRRALSLGRAPRRIHTFTLSSSMRTTAGLGSGS